MRKKFDIKYRPQIESGEYKVETEDGNPVVVMDWDWNHYGKHSIAVKVTCEEKNLGYLYSDNGDPVTLFAPDLFIVTPEPELTEFEKAFDNLAESYHSDGNPDEIACCKEYAAELLEIGRKEIIKQGNIVIPVDDFNKRLCVAMEHAREEALKDLPRWKKCSQNTIYSTKCNLIVNGIGRYIILDGYMIDVDRLKKLPGFKEDE